MSTPLLEACEVCKTFGSTVALQGVSMEVYPGEVVAVVGENGAGKSTLMKILAGNFLPSTGTIKMRGHEVRLHTPLDAIALGVSLIHQELSVFPHLSVAENVCLGQEPLTSFTTLNRQEMEGRTAEVLSRLGASFSPRHLAGALSVADQQLVEIARALGRENNVLIMDEPTAPLSEPEADRLFEVIASLRQTGTAVVYISHRLAEVVQIADRAVVLRDGKLVGRLSQQELSEQRLIGLMVGRFAGNIYSKRRVYHQGGEAVLQVDGLLSADSRVNGVSFTLRKGEILGLAGLVGAGRTEIARLIYGADRKKSGSIALCGRAIEHPTPSLSMSRKLVFLPEDRKVQGLFLDMSCLENVVLGLLTRLARWGWRRRKAERTAYQRYRDALRIKVGDEQTASRWLSGGNQQKLLLARLLALRPEVLILDEPTQGVDVGAKSELYSMIQEIAEHGTGVLLISSEQQELLHLSDRVLVIREGRIVKELKDEEELTSTHIMHFACGVPGDQLEISSTR